ncbi:MAG TPA: PD-(D/E)XK nuclease family protein, partial [Myxococcaceae bacterium]|nr:PD-(D/E)XK nuclease family protein [Myxococcaceae bacterium]
DARLRELVDDLDVNQLPPPDEAADAQEVDLPAQEARIEAAVRRVRVAPAPALPEVAVVEAESLQDFLACPRRYRYVHRLGLRAEGVPWEAPPREARPYVERDAWGETPGPTAQVLALLRAVDFRLADAPPSELRAHLEARLHEAGWDAEAEGVAEALAAVERFLGTPFARKLAASPVSRVHRALPFVLELSGAESAAIEGEVDLLWETPAGEARLVAFRPGRRHPRGVEAHGDGLVSLFLAARRMVREGVPIQVGVAFLGEPVPEPEFLSPPRNLEEAAERLRVGARALVEADVAGRWPAREQNICVSLGCGFAEHCHRAPRTC